MNFLSSKCPIRFNNESYEYILNIYIKMSTSIDN